MAGYLTVSCTYWWSCCGRMTWRAIIGETAAGMTCWPLEMRARGSCAGVERTHDSTVNLGDSSRPHPEDYQEIIRPIWILFVMRVHHAQAHLGFIDTPNYGSFLQCLSTHSHNYGNPIPIYTPNNSSFSSILNSRIQNLRFISPIHPKPYIITTPLNEAHVQAIVICSRKHGFFIRIRSGGHDYEGLSYTSPLTNTPFVLLDLSNLNSIDVDIDKRTAWVQTGATIGQLYYRIAEKSLVHAFAAGACTTIGVGGHFSGGGNGFLTRKYGLSADNVVDAKIVNVNGEILSKESMGEDPFWAIRGGGGTSFGVVLSWKINLVVVPPNVTVFSVSRTLEQGATDLVHKWQYIAYKLPKDLALFASLTKANASNTTTTSTGQASFQALFLGGTTELLEIMQENFSELGLKREDCIEMSWIQSVLFLLDCLQQMYL
ncbi:hypothetical protein Scep_022835 [Stephania cephalantha]|uniref:FAD-binding PCMH-type domain-containing protein n=1 Tax=Stephania cephalantha TaxID=152367 RepID=A0AAP0I2G5_9MAGN